MNANFENVLVIEPDAELRTQVRELLMGIGIAATAIHETDDAEEGARACQCDDAHGPHIILLAMTLAGAHGDEWLQRLRTHQGYLPVPVVLLGVDDDDARIDVALAAGAECMLSLVGVTPIRVRRTLGNAVARYRSVRELAASDARYRSLAESAPGLLWMGDEKQGFTFVSSQWLEYCGRTLEEELGEGWMAGIHPEDVAHTHQALRAAYAQMQPFQIEFRMLRHDGAYRWIENRGHPRFDTAGNFVGFTGACTDVTERNDMLAELRESEGRFRTVLRIAKVSVFTLDRDLRYNRVYNSHAGFKYEPVVGKRDEDLLPPKAAAPFTEFKRAALQHEKPLRRRVETNIDGQYACFDMTAERLLDEAGEIAGLTVVAIDISEAEGERQRARFLAEASQLLNASLDYATTLQQVARAIVPNLADWCSVDVVTADGRIDQVAVAHIDPDKVAWAKDLRQQNPPALDDPVGVANVIRTGKSEFYPEITREMILATSPSKEELAVHEKLALKSLLTVPLLARGRALGALTLVWSDSDRRYEPADLEFARELAVRAGIAIDNAWLYAEAHDRAQELHELSASLEQRVEERTLELERSNQDLDQFAYVASHDLKAPLRALDHLSVWILEDAGHMLPERSRGHLLKMQGRIKRMEGLLDDLLAYSRAGRQHGAPTWVDLGELVTRSVETVSPPDNFEVQIRGDLPTIYTAHVPLETVVRNLVGNAVKHHDKPNGRIVIHVAHEPDQMKFTIQDDGPGIDPAYHERIFQMFQTLRPRDQVEGSGIGLSVVKKIVEARGGTISVDANIHMGTQFTFTWPYQAPAENGV